MKKIFFLFILCVLLSCSKHTTNDITYLYINDYAFSENNPRDSLMVYKDAPFEKSLELYKETDSVTKFVYPLIYMSIFKLEKQKFAILADSVSTSFFKFMPNGEYKKEHIIEIPIGMNVVTQQKDINKDGYKDILLTVSSGGSYGDDVFLLFYDPKNHNLIHQKGIELRNTKLQDNTIISSTRFLNQTYEIKGYSLSLKEEVHYLQNENDNKKVITKFDRGKITSRDTLIIEGAE